MGRAALLHSFLTWSALVVYTAELIAYTAALIAYTAALIAYTAALLPETSEAPGSYAGRPGVAAVCSPL